MKKIDGWYLPDDEKFFASRILNSWDPKYERKERINVWRHLLHSDNPKRVAIDIGSNIGMWSNFLSTFFETVYAFDPSPLVQDCYQKNILDRKINVNFFDVGLGEFETEELLNISRSNSGGSSIINKTRESTKINVKTLDSFNILNVDFIKIDTEGYELPILKGAIETLKREKPLVFIEKQDGARQQELLDFMKDNNAVKLHDWLRNEIWSFNPEDKEFMTIFGNYKIFKREYNRIMKEANSDISK